MTMQALSRLRAQELITLSTGTTQVAQKRPPKTFWTSKRPFSTSLYSAALWHIVGLPGLPRWDGHPCLSSLGSLDLLYMLAQKPQLPPPGHFWNKLERSTQGEPSLRGRRALRGPRLEAATDSAAEVDLSEDGSKEPETLRGKWEQTGAFPKKAQGGQAASP